MTGCGEVRERPDEHRRLGFHFNNVGEDCCSVLQVFFQLLFFPLSLCLPLLCVFRSFPFYSVFNSFACYSLDKRLGFHFTISKVVGFVGFCAQSVRAVGFVSGVWVFHRYLCHLLTAELW